MDSLSANVNNGNERGVEMGRFFGGVGSNWNSDSGTD